MGVITSQSKIVPLFEILRTYSRICINIKIWLQFFYNSSLSNSITTIINCTSLHYNTLQQISQINLLVACIIQKDTYKLCVYSFYYSFNLRYLYICSRLILLLCSSVSSHCTLNRPSL